MSALPPKADITAVQTNVRFVPIADIRRLYSITSSARESRVAGTSSPSAFAVLRLITSLNFVDCTTGKSVGLPARRKTGMPVYRLHQSSATAVADSTGPQNIDPHYFVLTKHWHDPICSVPD